MLKKKKVLLGILLLVFLSSCGSAAPPPSSSRGNSTSNSSPERNYESIRIPNSKGVAPNEIFEQIMVGGRGGNEGGAIECPCISTDGSQLELYGFAGNQRLRLVAYYSEDGLNYEYLDDWLVTTDSLGELTVKTSGLELSWRIAFFAFDPNSGRKIGPASQDAIPIN